MEKKIRNRVKEREETVKKQQFGSAREGTKGHIPIPRLGLPCGLRVPLNLASRGLFVGPSSRAGRTDGRCIPIGPMTFSGLFKAFLAPALLCPAAFPTLPSSSIWGLFAGDDGCPYRWDLWDVRGGMLRCFGEGGCFKESPSPRKIMFFTFFSALSWLKTSDEEQCTCTGSRDAVLYLRGLCLGRSIRWRWRWDTKSFPHTIFGGN